MTMSLQLKGTPHDKQAFFFDAMTRMPMVSNYLCTKKTSQLRSLITSRELVFFMEAHNGISAKIAEESGFKGLWASGLTISAALGVRDNNEASWSQVLEVLEFMSDATSIPILFDGDTGYGNFNNARILVKKLEQRGIAGVCIEDKLFPKTNSFIDSEKQPLADVEEFCGKINAMKDVQKDKDFVVAARVEAFVAGWGLYEAIRRAESYRKAGADAVLIHSKKRHFSEIDEFMREWGDRHPVIIVPTKYYSTPAIKFRDLGISIVIWANHAMRAAITAMQKVTKQIYRDESLVNVESAIASVEEIFRLQGAQELEEAKKRYLPSAGKNVNAVILAAAQGEGSGLLTKDIPKTLLKLSGRTILATLIHELNMVGIKDITVVRGFAKEKIASHNFKTIDNDEYLTTTELYSLYLARDEIRDNTIICYGDILFKGYVLNELLNKPNDITIVADADCENNGAYHEYVRTNIPYSRKLFFTDVFLTEIDTLLYDEHVQGEFIGLFKVTARGGEVLKRCLDELILRDGFRLMRMKDLFTEVIKSHPVAVTFIKGSWLDINTIVDLQGAETF